MAAKKPSVVNETLEPLIVRLRGHRVILDIDFIYNNMNWSQFAASSPTGAI